MTLQAVLITTLVAQSMGTIVFAQFEVETPIWRRLLKWTIFHGGTVALYLLVGPWCLLFPAFALVAGSTVHFVVCRKQGFHPIYATPRRSTTPIADGLGLNESIHSR